MKALVSIEKANFTYGVVVSVGYGVANIVGMLSSFVGETFVVCSELTEETAQIGMVVNLSRDESMQLSVGSLLINPGGRVMEGSKVRSLGSLASIPLGDFVVGSILDPMGNLVFGSTSVNSSYRWVIESPSPGIIERESVFEPLSTGLIAVDSMVPVGRGQRELVVGDRQTGKTSIGVDTILNQKFENVISIYLPIGQKSSSVLEVFLALVRRDAVANLAIVVASASASAVSQFLCSYTGAALSEFFMLVKECPCFIMFDDLSRHAIAYREIYLLLRRPPGREAYPGEIFFVHSKLLERSAKMKYSLGGGSCTSFPVIETLAGDVSAYITTNVISITDGQIFLSIDLFLSGIKPAVDVGLSVTRVGSAAQWPGMRLVSGSYKLQLAQYAELQAFSQFASDLGEETLASLSRGKRLVEMLKQFCGSPMDLMCSVGILSVSGKRIFSEIPLENNTIPDFISKFRLVPAWTFLVIPVDIIARSILTSIISRNSVSS